MLAKTVYCQKDCSYLNTLIYHRLKNPLLLVSQIVFDTRSSHDNQNLPLDILSTAILTLLMVSRHRWYIFVLPMFSCTTSLWFWNVCGYLIISMTHCDGAGSWNHSLWKTGIRLSCMVNTIATDTMANVDTNDSRSKGISSKLLQIAASNPADTRRISNVIMTSKRRRDVVLTS